MRCIDGIAMTEAEFLAIVEWLRALPVAQVRRVLTQEKRRPWFEETTYLACLFIDTDTDLCLIYPARPLICRLFGRIAHLPCPIERAPADGDPSLLIADPDQPRRTLQQWMTQHGIFDLLELLEDAELARYEL
jgi:hypothetical protein